MERIILILPNNVVYKPGFKDAIAIIKDIASQLSTTIKGVVLRDDLDMYEKVSGRVRPNIKIGFHSRENWDALYENDLNDIKSTDLVILISARRGTVAWNPQLEDLPKKLATLNRGNFIVFYPTEMKETDIRGSRD